MRPTLVGAPSGASPAHSLRTHQSPILMYRLRREPIAQSARSLTMILAERSLRVLASSSSSAFSLKRLIQPRHHHHHTSPRCPRCSNRRHRQRDHSWKRWRKRLSPSLGRSRSRLHLLPERTGISVSSVSPRLACAGTRHLRPGNESGRKKPRGNDLQTHPCLKSPTESYARRAVFSVAIAPSHNHWTRSIGLSSASKVEDDFSLRPTVHLPSPILLHRCHAVISHSHLPIVTSRHTSPHLTRSHHPTACHKIISCLLLQIMYQYNSNYPSKRSKNEGISRGDSVGAYKLV